MLPNPDLHKPEPGYLRRLVRRIGWSQRKVAEELQIPKRTLEHYLSPQGRCPYAVQYALEVMALIREGQLSTPAMVAVTTGEK